MWTPSLGSCNPKLTLSSSSVGLNHIPVMFWKFGYYQVYLNVCNWINVPANRVMWKHVQMAKKKCDYLDTIWILSSISESYCTMESKTWISTCIWCPLDLCCESKDTGLSTSTSLELACGHASLLLHFWKLS